MISENAKVNGTNKENDVKQETIVVSNKPPKGSMCSINGRAYEELVWNICTQVQLKGSNKPFCSINKCDLGGCSKKNDLECDYINSKDICIEIKKANTPDWMQLSIKPDEEDVWRSEGNNKIPYKSKKLFESIIKKNNIFNGKIPPFFERKLTHEEWKKIKKDTSDFNDIYIDCPPDTISRLYRYKGCQYIQISEYGLYHLGEDVCNFGVPLFECNQHLRVRTKIHTTCIKQGINKGYISASVTVAAKPQNIKNLSKSNFTLDTLQKIPERLCIIKIEDEDF